MVKKTEWIDGQISITSPSGSTWDDYICISIKDSNALVEFVEIRIKHEDFCRAIMGRGDITMEFNYKSLNKVGLYRVRETLIFEIPKGTSKYDENGMKLIEKLSKEAAGDGWEAGNYFGGQDSFFEKDGKSYARTSKYKFLTKKEHKAYLKSKGPFKL